MTFNAYLVRGKSGGYTLVDTVHADYAGELIERISSVTDPAQINSIIVNHTEPDHAGALPAVLAAIGGAEIYATVAAAKFLKARYGIDTAHAVKSGERADIDGREWQFLATPMVHWPDNMVSYLPQEQILFSNDAFGQHYATREPLDTQNDLNVALGEARHYYANIVMPYAAPTAKAVRAAAALPLKAVAPSHGVIWTEHISEIAELYLSLCEGEPKAAAIVFDSLWGGTAERANEAEKELQKSYSDIKIFDLRSAHISDVMAELSACKHICIGSPTYNGFPTPRTSTLLAEIEALKPPLKEYSVFGTFCWGGGASAKISARLDSLGLKKIFDLSRCE